MDTKTPDDEPGLVADMDKAEYAIARAAIIRDAAARQQKADTAAELERIVARRTKKDTAP